MAQRRCSHFHHGRRQVDLTARCGSPPPVVAIEEGVISRAVAAASPPALSRKSAVRPPCGLPSALALIATSVFFASLEL